MPWQSPIVVFSVIFYIIGAAPLINCGATNNATHLLPSREYCGCQHSDDYIRNVKNSTSSLDEFPWLAALFYQLEELEDNLCVGSLISNRYVLTTAQCLRPEQLDTFLTTVRLGEYNIAQKVDCISNYHLDLSECSEPTADFGVEQLIVHELFNKATHEHDIGLIRLNSTVQYSDYIRPICLPLPDTPRAKIGDTLVESGWGRTEYDGNVAKIKKKVSTKIIPNDACENMYKSKNGFRIRKGQMCTKDVVANATATCQGDYGGPLMFANRNQWSQEGIVSFGGKCGSGYPDVHVIVADYLDWILSNIRPS